MTKLTVTDQTNAILDAAHVAASGVANEIHRQPWSPTLIESLVLSILSFTVVVLLLGTILLWKNQSSGELVLKIFGIISIVGLSTVLLVAGYSNDQLTPIVGLFGAIAGYLLGKDSKNVQGKSDRET